VRQYEEVVKQAELLGKEKPRYTVV
jgi:hypothetical protein